MFFPLLGAPLAWVKMSLAFSSVNSQAPKHWPEGWKREGFPPHVVHRPGGSSRTGGGGGKARRPPEAGTGDQSHPGGGRSPRNVHTLLGRMWGGGRLHVIPLGHLRRCWQDAERAPLGSGGKATCGVRGAGLESTERLAKDCCGRWGKNSCWH